MGEPRCFFQEWRPELCGSHAGVAAGMGDAALLLATGAERRDNKYPPTASAATIMTASAMIQLDFGWASRCERHRRRCFVPRLQKLLRHFGIAELLGVKIHHRNTCTVFHLRLTQIVQMLFPVAELFQVFGDVLGEQDVAGIATIHHPLGNVDSGAGDVGASAYIHDSAHRAAVHTHAQLEFGMFL